MFLTRLSGVLHAYQAYFNSLERAGKKYARHFVTISTRKLHILQGAPCLNVLGVKKKIQKQTPLIVLCLVRSSGDVFEEARGDQWGNGHAR